MMKRFLFSLGFAIVAVVLPTVPLAQAQSGIVLKTFNVKAGKLLLDPARPRIYATLPLDNGIAVIDTNTNAVTTILFVGSTPAGLAISPDGTRLYTANAGSTSAAIGVIDLTNLTTLSSLPAPFKPVAIAAGLGNRVYVLSSGYMPGGGLAQIDATTGIVQAIFGGDVTYEGGFLQTSPDRKTLFFGNATTEPSTLAAFDISTATPGAPRKAGFNTTGSFGVCLTVSHNGNFLVFPNSSGNNSSGNSGTSLIPTNNLDGVLGSFQTGPGPGPATFSTDDSLLYQIQYTSPTMLKVFSTSTFTQLDSFAFPSPGGPYSLPPTILDLAVTAPNGYLYVAETGTTGVNSQLADYLRIVSTQRASFFSGSTSVGNGFYFLTFADGIPFGYYNFNFTPVLYHNQELRTVRAGSLLNEVCHDGISEVAFEAVPIPDLSAPTLKFQLHERAQATEEVVADGLLAAHEEPFSVADLLDGAMIALDGPVLPVGLTEGVPSHFQVLFFRGSKAA